jgi:hydroxymethylpyrimidine/phosphomethylpyrimidine kinase
MKKNLVERGNPESDNTKIVKYQNLFKKIALIIPNLDENCNLIDSKCTSDEMIM